MRDFFRHSQQGFYSLLIPDPSILRDGQPPTKEKSQLPPPGRPQKTGPRDRAWTQESRWQETQSAGNPMLLAALPS